MSGAEEHLAAWAVAMVAFSAFLPLLRRRRRYFVTAGALLFTPSIAYYSWTNSLMVLCPMVACIPYYLRSLVTRGHIDHFVHLMVLPTAIVGLIFWGLSYWLVPRVYYPGMRLFSIWPVLGIQLVVWPTMFILFYLYSLSPEVTRFFYFVSLYVLFPASIVWLIYRGLVRWVVPKK